MFLRASVLSVVLLLVSRVSGLARESALAAALGVGPLADAVVLMLSLPDLLVGLALAGAMSYVLLPYWSKLPPADSLRHQGQTGLVFALIGVVVACVLWAGAPLWANVLGAGLAQADAALAERALLGTALALPLAFVAAVLSARLQHCSDTIGLYAANILVNSVLLSALIWLALFGQDAIFTNDALTWMLGALIFGMLARVAWQGGRLTPRKGNEDGFRTIAATPLSVSAECQLSATQIIRPPTYADWFAASLVSGLPIAAYLMARSLASREGVGALTTFNYAWKLVELPQLLVVQVLAVLALPVLSRAVAQSSNVCMDVFKQVFALAWVLACAAMVALSWGGPLLAQVLLGWGKMSSDALTLVAEWGSLGAVCLLPCAAVYMWLALLASLGQLRQVALAWLLLAGVASVVGIAWVHTGWAAMVWLNLVWVALAVCLFWRQRKVLMPSVPWSELVIPTGVALLGGVLAHGLLPMPWWRALAAGAVCVVCVLWVAYRTSACFRLSLKPDVSKSLPIALSD